MEVKIMNDEIKEILDWLKDEDIYLEDYGYQYKRISLKDTKILLDYITNLQQENEELKKNQRFHKNGVFSLEYDKETLSDMVEDLQQENERLNEILVWKQEHEKELHTRIEKAIEYIEDNTYYKSHKGYVDLNDLLNILQNGSEEK